MRIIENVFLNCKRNNDKSSKSTTQYFCFFDFTLYSKPNSLYNLHSLLVINSHFQQINLKTMWHSKRVPHRN